MDIMKKSKLLPSVIALAALTAAFIVFCGCEDEPSMSDLDSYFENHPYVSDPRTEPTEGGLEISPANASVSMIGETVLFSVKGGESPFTWDVSISAGGSIAAQDNDRDAIYTCKVLTNNNVIAYDHTGRAGIADISSVSTQAVAALAISPTTASVTNNGGFASFAASGGTSPYTWSVKDVSKGSIASSGTANALYQRIASGDNTVILADSAGGKVYAIISQP